MPIPVAMGLLGPDGNELPTRLAGETAAIPGTRLLRLDRAEQDFVFEDVPARPVPSLLRGFSAPVKLAGVTPERLRFLATHDTDPFVRWDSGQSYATLLLLDLVAAQRAGKPLSLDEGLVEAQAALLAGADADRQFAAEALVLPAEAFVADQMAVVDPDAIHAARQFLRGELGRRLGPVLHATYERLEDAGEYRTDAAAIGRRALRNACLAYLAAAGAEGVALARAQFDAATNMTDLLAALTVLAATDGADREAALSAFHACWRHDDLVLDKWFSIQATSPRPANGRGSARAGRPPRFRPAQPEPGARPGRRVFRRQPGALPHCLGRRLPLPGGYGDRARSVERADGIAAGRAAGYLAAPG